VSEPRASEPVGTVSEPQAGEPEVPEEMAHLEEERDFLLTSLRDLELEREASDIDDTDYRTLRDDYTARAAAVLHALETARSVPSPPEPDDAGTSPRHAPTGRPRGAPARAVSSGAPVNRARRTLVGITIVLVVAVGGGVGLASFTGNRGGGNVSGKAPSETARHVATAQQLEGEGKAAEALKEYDAAITADAGNVVALTYKGWLLGRAGFNDPAIASLDKAIATNPGYPDAHFFRGMVLYQGRQDPAGAVPEFEAYLASNPPPSAAAAVRDVLEKARKDAANPAPPAPGAPAPAPTPEPAPPG